MAPIRVIKSSSDDDDSDNDIGSVKVNGVTNGDAKSTPEPLDPKLVGMQTGMKNLYSGKEDRKGRFHWQDTVPEDVGKPAEDAETAKWALLVRHVKVYNDPRRVLRIHSIVVQSPLLKKVLAKVFKDYPGVTVGLRRLELSDRFEPVVHRWSQLKQAIADIDTRDEDGIITKEHAELFYDVLYKEFKSLLEDSRDMLTNGVMTYDYLWTVFQPAQLIYTRVDGQDTALKLTATSYGTDRHNRPCFWITGKYIDWNGSQFGTQKLNVAIYPFKGTKKIVHMTAYPFDHLQDVEAMRQSLLARGEKVEQLAGSHYKSYHGIAWNYDACNNQDKYAIKGRIVIDTYGWNKFVPNRAIRVTALNQKEQNGHSNGSQDDKEDDEYCESDDADYGMPPDGTFADEFVENRAPLTVEQKLLCTPLVRGYALKTKQWLNFFVNSVREIEWNDGAFKSLVLPASQKELILGFTKRQQQSKDVFDDVIEGKGRGIILLLCGPPGVGKTLTAESVSEEMKVPLFVLAAGDLGLDPRMIETKLNNVLEMCTRWNAILLLDEADIFLEKRSLHELERNKLVSIFLRLVEYHEGIMFLTTNRVETFDPAFQSRIHISIDYPDLSIQSRYQVWRNFLAAAKAAGQPNTVSDAQVNELSVEPINGRQIKNVLKTAQLLALERGQPMSYDHITTVLLVTQHFHKETKGTKQVQDSLYG